jgi:Caspase domain
VASYSRTVPLIAALVSVAMPLLAVTSSASALTMAECSEKYKAARAAGTLNGQLWNDFRKAECGYDALPYGVTLAKPAPVVKADSPGKLPNTAKITNQGKPSNDTKSATSEKSSDSANASRDDSRLFSSAASHRIALVIGNSRYENVPALSNAVNDAATIAEVLKQTGFEHVTFLKDLNRDSMTSVLRRFALEAEKADWAVVYYAGHGMEVGGINYLIPIDARLATDRDISFEAIALDQVLNAAERSSKLRLVILDACRDNPFKSQMKRTIAVATRSVGRGLARVEPDPGTLVVYSAKDGEQALDGAGSHSPFATALAKNLVVPGLEVRRLFDVVRDDVLDTTHRQQQPFSYGSISGRQDYYFIAPRS